MLDEHNESLHRFPTEKHNSTAAEETPLQGIESKRAEFVETSRDAVHACLLLLGPFRRF
jgi:hypothetical protein